MPSRPFAAVFREVYGDEPAPSENGEFESAQAEDDSSAGEDEESEEESDSDAEDAAHAQTITWKLAMKQPLASHDGNAVLSPGPYATRCDATSALYDFECAQGRSVVQDKKASNGHTLIMICRCRDVQDAREGAQLSKCEFTAHMQAWRGKKGDGRWYLTKYEPHDWGTCRSKPHMSMDQLLADRTLVELVQRSDGKMKWRDIAAHVRDTALQFPSAPRLDFDS